MNVFDLSAKITMDINGYLKGMGTAKAVAISTMSAIGGAAQGFFTDSINTGKQFSSSMSQVAATLGKTTDEVDDLRVFAQDMGRTTAFSATQAADALNYMALAGYDSTESMETLPAVLDLAAAGNMDLAKASDMVTDSQTAFGMSQKRTKKMVDEMAKAASTGNTSVEQLGEAFLVVGGLAKELNGGMVTLADGTEGTTDGIQEMEIALTAMANAGIKGSEAGTHMRNMLLKLSSPTKQGVAQMDALGIKVFDAQGKMKSLRDIFGDLNESLSTLTQEQKIQAISDLFNTRDMASAEALLSAVGEDWDSIGEAILSAEGAAGKMAETQLDNLAGDTKLLESAVEGAQIALSDALEPALRKVTQLETKFVADFTEGFQSLPPEVQTVVAVIGHIGTKIMEVAPQVVGMAGSMSQIVVAMKGAKDGASGFGNSMKSLGGKLGIASAIIGGVVIGLQMVDEASDKLAKKELDLKKEVEELAEAYSDSSKTTQEVISGLSEYNSYEEKRLALLTQLEEAQNAQKQAQDKATEGIFEQQAAVDALTRTQTEELGVWDNLLNGFTNGAIRVSAMGKAVSSLDEAQTTNNQTLEDASNDVAAIEAELKKLEEEEKRAATANDQFASGFATNAETITVAGHTVFKESADALEAVTNAMIGMQGSLQESGSATILNFEKVAEAQQASGEQMKANWAAQIENTKNWQKDLSELLKLGINEGIVQQFAAAGPASSAEVKAMINDINSAGKENIPTMVSSWNSLYADSLSLANATNEEAEELVASIGTLKAGGEEAFKGLAESFGLQAKGIGEGTSNGFIQGAMGMLEEIEKVGEESGEEMIEGLEVGTDSHSPSRKAKEVGKNVGKGLEDGLNTQKAKLYQLTNEVGQKLIDAISVGINRNKSSVFTSLAALSNQIALASRQMPMSFASGWAQGGMYITTAISQSMSAASASANTYTGSFGMVGYNISAGLASGVYRGAYSVYQAVSSVVNNALSSARSAAGVHSPSTKMAWIGNMLTKGLGKGIEESVSNAVEPAKDMAAMVNDTVENSLDTNYEYTSSQTTGAEEQKKEAYPTNVTLNIYGREGQDVDELADIILTKMNRLIAREEAVFA